MRVMKVPVEINLFPDEEEGFSIKLLLGNRLDYIHFWLWTTFFK